MNVGKIKSVRTHYKVPCPGFRPGREVIEAEKVGPIKIINIGVTYEHDGAPIVVPWTGVKWLDLEKTEATEAKGRSRKAPAAPPAPAAE